MTTRDRTARKERSNDISDYLDEAGTPLLLFMRSAECMPTERI